MNHIRNRAQVKLRLVEIGTYALTDVALYEGRTETIPTQFTWDGKPPAGSALYLGQVTGRSANESIGSAPLKYDDFDVQCQLYIFGSPDPQTAEVAAENALNAFDGVLRSLRGLIDPQDRIETASPPVSSSEPAPWDVDWASITDQVGPYHPIQQPTAPGQPRTAPKSWPGVVDFSIACRTSFQ